MALAGLWKAMPGPHGEVVRRSFAIITTGASGVMDVLQDRMPVMLDEADWPLWLGERDGDVRSLLMDSQAGQSFRAWQVSTKVNHQKNDGPELLYPVHEVNPGDPFISCQLAAREVAWSRARLEALRQRYGEAIRGRPQTQPDQAFQKTVAALGNASPRLSDGAPGSAHRKLRGLTSGRARCGTVLDMVRLD